MHACGIAADQKLIQSNNISPVKCQNNQGESTRKETRESHDHMGRSRQISTTGAHFQRSELISSSQPMFANMKL